METVRHQTAGNPKDTAAAVTADTEDGGKGVSRRSALLVLLLIVPAGIIARAMYIRPETVWVAEVPYTAIGILGSFASVLLSVFIIARYRAGPGVLYVSAGLMAMGIIDSFRAISLPGSTEFAWLHAISGLFGGAFFLLYAMAESRRLCLPSGRATASGIGWLLGTTAPLALLGGILPLVFAGALPALKGGGSLPVAWVLNAVPAGLFLMAGIMLFLRYRRTGASEHFLLTAILIFLVQASQVFFLATVWGIVWWTWQALRVAVYVAVLGYVLREYMLTSDSLAHEVEERKRVEKALRKAEENWRNSFNSLEEVMLIIDRDYRIENMNSRGLAFLGKAERDVVGRKCHSVIHERLTPCEHCPMKESLATKSVKAVERYDELFERYFCIKSSPILDERGEVAKCVYSMSDITERVRAEARQKMLQREVSLSSRLASIGKVAAGITHEINNPLTGVIAFSQMLMQMDIPENMREAVEVINDGANRVVGIVDKLLTFARRNRPEKEYADINGIITNTLALRSYEMRTNDITVVTELDPDLPRTMANVGQLQQVFLNIIINAEQAMTKAHGRGVLTIRTARVGNRIRASVSDTGPGIPEDIIDRLFDPFFTTKEEEGGSGLGLSISYGIINEHGGRLRVRSTPGKGATFIIDLPVVAKVKEALPGETADQEPAQDEALPVRGARVLVIDDEPHICRALHRLLSREGFHVDTVPSARAALRRLDRERYDLILLDLRMPGMNGIEFYERLKEVDPELQRRVVCVTGDIVSRTNQAFLDEVGIPCVAKPFSVDELMCQVKLVLEGERCASHVSW
jgi:PAS domain S-box-containing protein